MYDLNQISYDYILEVTSRFKGLDPVDRVPEEPRTEVGNTVQEAVTKSILKRNARRQSGCVRRLYKQLRKEEKEKAREKGNDISN